MKKNICVWTILVRIFGPSSRNNNPKLLFFFCFGRCIFFCLQPRPTSFKKKHNKSPHKTHISKRCFLSWQVSKMITDNTPSKTGESTKRLGWIHSGECQITPQWSMQSFQYETKVICFWMFFWTWEVQYITRPYQTCSYLFCFDFARLQIMYIWQLCFSCRVWGCILGTYKILWQNARLHAATRRPWLT